MTSPGHHEQPPASAPPAETDEGQAAEQAIGVALAELEAVREQPVSGHVERFEAVHTALTDALNKAENLLSASNGHGS